jgi:hypothetical protein
LGDEDLSGFEAVLTALASHDKRIQDEIRVRSNLAEDDKTFTLSTDWERETRPENIVWDEYDADPEQIRQGFANVRERVFPTNTRSQIRTLCINHGIDTSVDYRQGLQQEMENLTENPCFSGETWYDFLHPGVKHRIDGFEFVNSVILPNRLLTGSAYDEWRGVQPSDVIAGLPSVQHINDGYFGADDKDFNGLIEKFSPVKRRIR